MAFGQTYDCAGLDMFETRGQGGTHIFAKHVDLFMGQIMKHVLGHATSLWVIMFCQTTFVKQK